MTSQIERVLAVAGRRTPTVVVVKCGTEAEAASEKKPGNRGKRDSQLILMNFFSRVTYNDRMTPLDFDLFRKLHILMGVTPDYFEVCLMVGFLCLCSRVFDLVALGGCRHESLARFTQIPRQLHAPRSDDHGCLWRNAYSE